MMDLGLTEVLLFLILGAIILYKYAHPKKNLPPGPSSYPIIGNVAQLTSNAHLKMAEWAQEYGKIYRIYMGTTLAIVVNDIKIIKEMLFDANFSIRPRVPLIDLFSGGEYGVIATNDHAWEEQRRWSLRKLRDYGFGKTSMEGLIMDEVNEAVERLKKSNKEFITAKEIFDVAVLNALWTILNGKRLGQTDPEIRALLDTFQTIIPTVSKSGLMFAPWLKYIYPKAQKTIEDCANSVMKFARDAVAHHFETHKEEDSRDFIDEYISEIKKTTDPNSSFYKETGRKNLEGTISDLIQAGSETTANTILWLLIFLCENPEAQEKVHKELDSIVGSSRSVQLSDKPNLPYTEAVILETLRHSSLSAAGVVHSAIEDKVVNGYTIPKGSWIYTNIYFVHHDPAIWGDPENFRPERFLSSDGTKVVRPEALIPFQMGRRQCLGESLARDSVFLFASNVFHQFNWKRKRVNRIRVFFLLQSLITFVLKAALLIKKFNWIP